MPFSTPEKGIILVFDATSDAGKRIVASLLQQGRQVRAVVPDTASGQAALSSLPAAPGAQLEVSSISSTSTSGVSNVRTLIWPMASPTATASNLQTLLASLISTGAIPKTTGEAVYTPDGLSPAKEWGPVDDVVMGGVSSSNFQVRQAAAENGTSPAGIFGGTVTTANNGGFASTRTKNLTPPLNLAAYDGIELKVKGDGQRYKCVIKIDSSWDGVGYTSSFDTLPSTWQSIKIPFSSLVPVFRAKTQTDAAPFDASRVTSIQLMLSKFEYDGRLNPTFREGKFELPVEKIEAYSSENKDPQVVLVASGDGGDSGGSTIREKEAEEVLQRNSVAYKIVSVSDFV